MADKTTETKVNTTQEPTKKVENKGEVKQKTFTEEQVKAMMDDAVKKAVAEAMANIPQQQSTTIVQMKPEEYVTVLFVGVICDGTVVSLGELGQINRAGGTLRINKEVFFQKLDYNTEQLLRNRKVLVIDGLTDEERKRYGVDYKENELLTEDTFLKLLDYPQEKIVDIFSQLCAEHKTVVAHIFATAYSEGSNKIHLDTLKKLNKISKEVDKDGMFTLIIKDLSKKMGDDED